MAKTQDPKHEHADGYKLIDKERDNESDEFDEWEEAQERLNDMVELHDAATPEHFRIEPIYDSETDEPADTETDVTTTDKDTQDVELVDEDITDAPDTTPLKESDTPLPKISPVEDTARSIIQQLDHTDMTRLVWDPDANSSAVPYDPHNLPYNRPEPSAEAFDMFATIIEGSLDVMYSVADVSFADSDDTFECTVVIEKQTPDGTKRIPGFKTRLKSKSTGQDHWRERLYSKARRNALKQDIPSTWIAALLSRYNEIEQ